MSITPVAEVTPPRVRHQAREAAALTKDVMVIGVINRIEIWDPERWESFNTQNQETFADISEEVFPGL